MLLYWALGAAALAVGPEEIADAILTARDRVRGPVLVCPAGPDADKAVARALRDHGHLDIPVRRIPTAGDIDKETAAALAASGLQCALRVEPSDAGFDVVEHGTCDGPAKVVLAVAPEPAPPTEDAREPSRGGEDPPDEDPPEPVTADEWIARQARYDRERLLVVELPPDPARAPEVTWEMVDGAGARIPTRRLAEIGNDDELILDLDDELRRGRRASRAMMWTGIGLALISPTPLIGVESGAPQANQDRLWSSLFLLGGAGLTLALSSGPKKAAVARQEEPSRYLEAVAGEELAGSWNNALWASLELDQRPEPEPGGEAATEEDVPARVVIGTGGGEAPDSDSPAAEDAPATTEAPPERVVLPAAVPPPAADADAGTDAAEPAPANDDDSEAPAPERVILAPAPEGSAPSDEPAPDRVILDDAPASDDVPATDPPAGEEASSDR